MLSPVDDIVGAVRAVVGKGSRRLNWPRITASDAERVSACVLDPEQGRSYIARFERSLSYYTGVDNVVTLSSGTAALHLALLACGIKPGDEVLVPALTFAATANAIVHAGAIPHFVDVRQHDLGISPFKLRQYLGHMDAEHRARIKACIAVHLLGNPCSIEEIKQLCDYYGIALIEDAAEALGSTAFINVHCGTLGKAGVLSFNLNKIVSTGGGGALITNDTEMAAEVRHLAGQAKLPHPYRWDHDAIGFNYRMPAMCAALGIGQLERLPDLLKRKAAVAARYCRAFQDVLTATPIILPGANDWVCCAILDSRCIDARDAVLDALTNEGFEARALFTPLHTLAHFKHYPRQSNTLDGAEDLFRRAICLPSTPRDDE